MKFKLHEEVKGKFESEDAFWAAVKAGFEVEKEHASSMDNSPILVLRIVLDHLSEDIAYYTKLKKMEEGDKPKEDETVIEKPVVDEKEDKVEKNDDDEKKDENDTDENEEDKKNSLKV